MIIKCIVSLTAIVLACHSPAEVVRSMLGARGAIMANPKMGFGGLTFTALSPGSTVSMFAKGSAPVVSLETSSDGLNWSPFIVGATTYVLANVGDKIYFRAGSGGNIRTAVGPADYNSFSMSGTIAASGNVMSLLSRDFDDATTITSQYCFGALFRGCISLASAPQLPATTLADYCYHRMFYTCSSLQEAPELPAITLADNCYREMFYGCAKLASAPQLPAKVLATECYYTMFYNCKKLASAPQLPATVLAESCYRGMFMGCTSLASAPQLPATVLAAHCYRQMFYNCEKLSSVQCSFTTWGAQTTDWMYGVGSTGTRTFKKPAALPTEYGTSKIPNGWTVVDL
jgi:hypothetical protein